MLIASEDMIVLKNLESGQVEVKEDFKSLKHVALVGDGYLVQTKD